MLKKKRVSQNDVCVRNTSEVQSFKIVIGKEDQCQNMRQRNEKGNVARNFNVHNTTEGHSNFLILPHILPHNHSIKVIIRTLEFEEIKQMNFCVTS